MSSLVQFGPFDPRVEDIWRGLEVVAKPSYFLSWGWIANWLACLPREEAPPLAVYYDDDGAPETAFFLGQKALRRHGVLKSSALYVNATGNERCDDVCIEHNGLLRAPTSKTSLEAVIEHLSEDWDELFLPAVDRTKFPELGKLGNRPGYRVRVDHEATAPYVDLDLVRSVDGGYLSVLSPTLRGQIRRARREAGDLTLDVARDATQASAFYDELLHLHATAARCAGTRNAFADPWLERLHRRLIETRLPAGEIQLLRLRSGDTTIGCLYNFIYEGRALFYQSGFAQFDAPDIHPGFLCHAAAVEHNADAGLDFYDLLASHPRYRHTMSTGETRLVWLRVQRRLARFAIEDQLRGVKQALSSWRQRHPVALPSRA